MKNIISLILIAALTLSLLSGCGQTGAGAPAPTETPRGQDVVVDAEIPEEAESDDPAGEEDDEMADTLNDFMEYWNSEESQRRMDAILASADIQSQLDAYYAGVLPLLLSGKENTVCSPLNLYLALSMLAETAGGETRAHILSALDAPDMGTLRKRVALLWNANEADIAVLKCLLANSLWTDESLPYHDDTLAALEEYHHAGAYTGTMGTPEMDQRLRDWTDEHTGDLLKEYTAGMHTTPDSVMELISAIYFKASWASKFSAELTDKGVFHGLKGDTPCDMMHKSGTSAFYWGDKFTAAVLGLNEGGSMVFLLPDEGTELAELLSDSEVMSLVRNLKDYENRKNVVLNLSIPKFDVSGKTDLRDAMTAMGMGDVFDMDRADFTSLTDMEQIYLSTAEHAACVSIDEDGVTGAAYTDFGLAAGAVPPQEQVDFVLDRPFLFTVTARDGSVLFAGTVTDIA